MTNKGAINYLSAKCLPWLGDVKRYAAHDVHLSFSFKSCSMNEVIEKSCGKKNLIHMKIEPKIRTPA